MCTRSGSPYNVVDSSSGKAVMELCMHMRLEGGGGGGRGGYKEFGNSVPWYAHSQIHGSNAVSSSHLVLGVGFSVYDPAECQMS